MAKRITFSSDATLRQRRLRILFECANAMLCGPDIIKVDGDHKLYVNTYRPSGVRYVMIPWGDDVIELRAQNPMKDTDYAKLVHAGAVLIWVLVNGAYTGQAIWSIPGEPLGFVENVHDHAGFWAAQFKVGHVRAYTPEKPWRCEECGKTTTTWEMRDKKPMCPSCSKKARTTDVISLKQG